MINSKFWEDQLESVATEVVSSSDMSLKSKTKLLCELTQAVALLEVKGGVPHHSSSSSYGSKPKLRSRGFLVGKLPYENDKPKPKDDTQELKPFAKMNLAFWEGFMNYVEDDAEFNNIFEKRPAQPYQYLNFYFNNPNCYMNVNQNRNTGIIEIEFVVKDDRNNIFENLKTNISVLEEDMGGYIRMAQNNPRRGNCSFSIARNVSFEEDELPETYALLAKTMVQFYDVLMERIGMMS